MIVELQKAFKDIIYRDENHSYYHKGLQKSLMPTTTYKKQFQNQFENKDYWLEKKAKEAGLTKEEMQDIWTEKNIVGVTRGSRVHNQIELLTWRKEMTWQLDMTGMATIKRQAYQYIKDHPNDYNIATELVCGNSIIGGQIDRLFEREGKILIGDYKTDSKTDEELKTSYGKKMKLHLNYLDDSILNGYYVQVNIYRQLLEEAGFKVDGMEIYHFCINNEHYTTYEVPFIEVIP